VIQALAHTLFHAIEVQESTLLAEGVVRLHVLVRHAVRQSEFRAIGYPVARLTAAVMLDSRCHACHPCQASLPSPAQAPARASLEGRQSAR